MFEGILAMSSAERERLVVIGQVASKVLRQGLAAERLGLCVRQVKRLVRAYRERGDAGLVSRQRGLAPNCRLDAGVTARLKSFLLSKYKDFGPTLAAEKLAELEGIAVSRETVRRLQIELGVWKPKRRRHKRVFQLRERRPRFGELIQIDASPHAWFEGRGPRCALIVFIDDATGGAADGVAIRAVRDDAGLSPVAQEPCRGARLSDGVLFGSARHFPRQCQGRGQRRRQDRVRPSSRAIAHRVDHRAHSAGQGPGRAGQPDPAGSAGAGDAIAGDIDDRGGSGLRADLHGAMERQVRHGAARRRGRASPVEARFGRARRGAGPARGAHLVEGPDVQRRPARFIA